MTIDKQIEEALGRLPWMHHISTGDPLPDDSIKRNQAIDVAIACLQAILEDDWYIVEVGPEDVVGAKEIKTRVKELLESSADVKEQSFN